MKTSLINSKTYFSRFEKYYEKDNFSDFKIIFKETKEEVKVNKIVICSSFDL
jgi:hypothetical protein